MRSLSLAVAGLVCSVLWLALLVATHFNAIPAGLGLLVAVYVSGSLAAPGTHITRTHRQ